MRPPLPGGGGQGISRFPCEVFPCVLRGLRPRRERLHLALAMHPLSPSVLPRRRRLPGLPIRHVLFSQFNTRPARTPANASPWPLQTIAHDSGPVWLARPSPYDFCIHNTSPVFIGAPRLNTRPARTPVNASPKSLQTSVHDSGPMWLARPSSCDSSIHTTPPVLIGALKVDSFANQLRVSPNDSSLEKTPGS